MVRPVLAVLALYPVGCVTSGPAPAVARGSERAREAPPAGTPSNLLVLVLDDVGADQIEVYNPSVPNLPHTPRLTQLAAEGIRFENGYAFPACTPARGAMLTGRYPQRYGLGNALDSRLEDSNLPLSEVTIPEMLRQSPHRYATALIGKWHLDSYRSPAVLFAPNDQGFDYYSGSLENLGHTYTDIGAANYYHWERVTNGRAEAVDRYATTVTVDDTLRRLDQMPEPWLMISSFNAPHVPSHVPPLELVHHTPPADCGAAPEQCFIAMMEAADTEIGRLLDSIEPEMLARTTVVLLADNGSTSATIQAPYDPTRGKGTLFDGGVHVPFIVTGPYVTTPGATSSAFVSITDLFATFAEIAQVPSLTGWDGAPLRTDSVSFLHLLSDPGADALPPRDQYVYSEAFVPLGPGPYAVAGRMVRTASAKMIRHLDETQLYRYAGALEGDDLLGGGAPLRDDAADAAELSQILDALDEDLVYEGP